jgi:hypothetical protein
VGFQKGQKRPLGSGRKKGVPNKKTLAKVEDFLASKDLHPAEEIVKIINEKKIVTDSTTNLQREEFQLTSIQRAELWLELQKFCQAIPKTLELTKGDGAEDLSEFDDVATTDLMKVIKPSISGTA